MNFTEFMLNFCNDIVIQRNISLSLMEFRKMVMMIRLWKVLTKHGPLEKGMANHFSVLALRTP